jgi:hypothetical protein
MYVLGINLGVHEVYIVVKCDKVQVERPLAKIITLTLDFDECYAYPCRNGGNCTDVYDSPIDMGKYCLGTNPYGRKCSCVTGWTGVDCETRMIF